jgi:HAE1 family hydrophobic/amphiphilic exporter-1
LGTAVFFGMIGVTAFGLVFTPVFYVIARWIAQLGQRRGKQHGSSPQPAE